MRERSHSQLHQAGKNVAIYWFWERQLSDRNFYPHFPNASNGEPQFVGFRSNVCDCLLTQPLWLSKPPQPALRIQQEFHSSPPSNAAYAIALPSKVKYQSHVASVTPLVI